jgi:hypothetical protein
MVIMDDIKLKLFNLTMYIKNNVHDDIKEQHYLEMLSQIAIIYKDIAATKIVNESDDDEDEGGSYNDDYIGSYT